MMSSPTASAPDLSDTPALDDLVVVEVVGSELEAELMCSILRGAGDSVHAADYETPGLEQWMGWQSVGLERYSSAPSNWLVLERS
jgi:hypothetical protein